MPNKHYNTNKSQLHYIAIPSPISLSYTSSLEVGMAIHRFLQCMYAKHVCIHTFFQSMYGNYVIVCFYLLQYGKGTQFSSKRVIQSKYAYTGVSLPAKARVF